MERRPCKIQNQPCQYWNHHYHYPSPYPLDRIKLGKEYQMIYLWRFAKLQPELVAHTINTFYLLQSICVCHLRVLTTGIGECIIICTTHFSKHFEIFPRNLQHYSCKLIATQMKQKGVYNMQENDVILMRKSRWSWSIIMSSKHFFIIVTSLIQTFELLNYL